MPQTNRIINGDCDTELQFIKSDSVDCCITSPPYFGLRDYGHSEQIGLEETPEQYISKLVEVFSEVKRVLKPTGTLWLNIGDSYNGTGNPTEKCFLGKQGTSAGTFGHKGKNIKELKQKDLIGIPWMLAFALRADGWYLRQDIIWHKPNPMPESVTDRCTKAHEYIFLFSKTPKYYFDADAIKTPSLTNENRPGGAERNRLFNYNSKENNNPAAYKKRPSKVKADFHGKTADQPNPTFRKISDFANKRSVWSVNTKPYKEAHFATFPPELITDCMKAGCPVDGLVLDPFMGSGTTAIVAIDQGKNYLGFELNEEYCKIANERIRKFTSENI